MWDNAKQRVTQKARQRAYRRLQEAHEDEFMELYNEERIALGMGEVDPVKSAFSKPASPYRDADHP
jgi:hypothetical protein